VRNLQTPRSVKEEGEGSAPGAGAEIPLQSLEKTMMRQPVSLQTKEVHAAAGGCPKEAATPWGACAGAGSWQDLWPHGERSPHGSRVAGRACDPVGDACWSSLFLEDCTPWEGPTLEKFVENCKPVGRSHVGEIHSGLSPVGGPPHWSRGRV